MELSEQTLVRLIEDVAAIKQAVLDMKSSSKEVSKLLEVHDGRLKELEVYKNQMVGKVSMIAIFFGFVGWAVTSVIACFVHGK